jgi:hypothetical protein
VASRVFLHVGLPKTGTTYLQTILWAHREALRGQGVLLPGRSARQHLWASGVVREDPRLGRRHPDAARAWDALTTAIRRWPGTALVSHEFFAGASADQARRAIGDLGDAEPHVVLTARETVGLLTARWQEWVKNGATTPIDRYPVREDYDPVDEWGWGTMDVADVLDRWGRTLPPEHVHLLTLPGPEEPRDELWRRFAVLVGIDPDSCDAAVSYPNESLGVVEVELLRRVNAELEGFTSAQDRGNWIRGYLAQGKLVPRGGERFWPSPDRVTQLRTRGDRAVARLRERRYDVVGDLDALLTPRDLPPRRHPSSVTDAELAAAGAETIAAMMSDVRAMTRRAQVPPEEADAGAEQTISEPVVPSGPRAWLRRQRDRVAGWGRRVRRRNGG